MEKPLSYRLASPGYTIYHRAALGGLGATVRGWGKNPPTGIKASLNSEGVDITWGDDIADDEAVRRILAGAFKLTEDNLIDLPGQGVALGGEDLRLAIHNALISTFLQHNKMRPSPTGEKGVRHFSLKTADDDVGATVTYKPVGHYAHQIAQKTGLLDIPGSRSGRARHAGDAVRVPQWCVPGATGGAKELEVPAADGFLLMFLMVACPVFILRSHRRGHKTQFCVVVPNVVDVQGFASSLRRIASRSPDAKRFSNSYLGRVVGGAEEAALRFLIDLEASETVTNRSIDGCTAIAMGKVAWDPNQINRSSSVKIAQYYPEIEVFRAANAHLGATRVLKGKDGQGFAAPSSPVPELVAANLATKEHWCAHFKLLVNDKKDFLRMCFAQKGLKAMNQAVKDVDDQAVIAAFQDAWKLTMRSLYDRAREEGLNGDDLIERERERVRNAILRTKTADALSSWFMRFCADATKGGALPRLRDDSQRIRRFIFNQRNFDRFQNLCLFALVSYSSDAQKTSQQGKD